MPIEYIDLPIIDKFNAFGGTVIAIATYFLGEHWFLFSAFLVLNLFDYITGIMKSKVLHNESSSMGLHGIVKKIGYWIMVVIAFGMGSVLNEICASIGGDISFIAPWLGWATLGSLILNELRSILENLVEAGWNVPPFLTKGLKVLEKVLEKQEELFDGDIELDKDHPEQSHVAIKRSPDELMEKDSVVLKIKTTRGED